MNTQSILPDPDSLVREPSSALAILNSRTAIDYPEDALTHSTRIELREQHATTNLA